MLCFKFLLIAAQAYAQIPERISRMHKDLSKAERIYLSPGLASVVEFPSSILEVRNGNPNVVKVIISPISPKELTLFLNGQSGPTNLIIRAGKRLFVFDIIPSSQVHQDYVKVSGAYSSPGLVQTNITESGSIGPSAVHHNRANGKVLEMEIIQ